MKSFYIITLLLIGCSQPHAPWVFRGQTPAIPITVEWDGNSASGTGFFVERKGYTFLVTCAHVIFHEIDATEPSQLLLHSASHAPAERLILTLPIDDLYSWAVMDFAKEVRSGSPNRAFHHKGRSWVADFYHGISTVVELTDGSSTAFHYTYVWGNRDFATGTFNYEIDISVIPIQLPMIIQYEDEQLPILSIIIFNIDDARNPAEIRVGEDIYLAGYPNGIGTKRNGDYSLTDRLYHPITRKGIISRTALTYLNFDIYSVGGDSGSPVYDEDNELVGIVSSTIYTNLPIVLYETVLDTIPQTNKTMVGDSVVSTTRMGVVPRVIEHKYTQSMLSAITTGNYAKQIQMACDSAIAKGLCK